jgi:hypothetical protein
MNLAWDFPVLPAVVPRHGMESPEPLTEIPSPPPCYINYIEFPFIRQALSGPAHYKTLFPCTIRSYVLSPMNYGFWKCCSVSSKSLFTISFIIQDFGAFFCGKPQKNRAFCSNSSACRRQACGISAAIPCAISHSGQVPFLEKTHIFIAVTSSLIRLKVYVRILITKALKGARRRNKARKSNLLCSFVHLCVPSWFILPLASFPLSGDLA